MSITTATTEYENWLRSVIAINNEELNTKHQKMAEGEFAFLRATFYRWAHLFSKHCPELGQAIQVLGVGDLHLENFGTWRDTDGRLCWGINDFDEACYLPYTNDLVRLATSAYFAIADCRFHLEMKEACQAIEKGYQKALQQPRPFVLAENHGWLRNLVISKLLDSDFKRKAMDGKNGLFKRFFTKYTALPEIKGIIPADATEALHVCFPQPTPPYEMKYRLAGLGSLGRQRFTAVAKDWQGGIMVREAKALAPSAWLWANQARLESYAAAFSSGSIYYPTILKTAVRSTDPWLKIVGNWVVRRLGPDAFKVEIDDIELPSGKEAECTKQLLQAMGKELANIHCSSGDSAHVVAKHLKDQAQRSPAWLFKGAMTMVEQTKRDFRNWQMQQRGRLI